MQKTEVEQPRRHSPAKPLINLERQVADTREIEQLQTTLKEQKNANEELLSERRSLMDLIQNLEE